MVYLSVRLDCKQCIFHTVIQGSGKISSECRPFLFSVVRRVDGVPGGPVGHDPGLGPFGPRLYTAPRAVLRSWYPEEGSGVGSGPRRRRWSEDWWFADVTPPTHRPGVSLGGGERSVPVLRSFLVGGFTLRCGLTFQKGVIPIRLRDLPVGQVWLARPPRQGSGAVGDPSPGREKRRGTRGRCGIPFLLRFGSAPVISVRFRCTVWWVFRLFYLKFRYLIALKSVHVSTRSPSLQSRCVFHLEHFHLARKCSRRRSHLCQGEVRVSGPRRSRVGRTPRRHSPTHPPESRDVPLCRIDVSRTLSPLDYALPLSKE